jgi:phosphotransacetylase
MGLEGFRVIDFDSPEHQASAAVAEVRNGRARLLAKGQIATPTLMNAVLDPELGLRVSRVVSQVVLMEIVAHKRRFLMADTGINVKPKSASRVEILEQTIEVAHALGLVRPRIALMAASESISSGMPETIDAAEIQRRNRAGEFPGALIQGPLSFDLAYSIDAGDKKRIEGEVVGSADAMVFPDLLSANLTVKAIMYTADCQFGGVLRGTSAPVAFMSRSDTASTRLNSLALALAILAQ